MSDATVAERSLVREWRDRLNEQVVTQPLLMVVAMRVAFGLDRDGRNELGDLLRERTERTGAEVEKAVSGLAWSTSIRAAWRDSTPGRDRIFMVIEVLSTVDRGMPFRVMQYEGMSARHLQDRGQWRVERIRPPVLYTD